MRKSGGKIVNRQELSAILGKSLPTISAWIKQQMPYVESGGRGRDWQFDTAAVIQWLANQQAAAAQQKFTTKEQVEKEILEVDLEHRRLKYALAAGEVVSLDAMERRLTAVFAEVRTSMRNIASRVSPTLVGESDEARIKSILRHEIDLSLETLSQLDVEELGQDDGEPG